MKIDKKYIPYLKALAKVLEADDEFLIFATRLIGDERVIRLQRKSNREILEKLEKKEETKEMLKEFDKG